MIDAKFGVDRKSGEREVCFGEAPLQRMPATAGKLFDGQAFKPAREARVLPY